MVWDPQSIRKQSIRNTLPAVGAGWPHAADAGQWGGRLFFCNCTGCIAALPSCDGFVGAELARGKSGGFGMTSKIGLVGLAATGAALARNIAGRGFDIALYSRITSVTRQFAGSAPALSAGPSCFGLLRFQGVDRDGAFVGPWAGANHG